MRLIVEAWHAVVGLRLEIGPDDPLFRFGREKRQAAAGNQIADEGGNEDGLARAGKTSHAEPNRRRQKVAQSRLCVFEKVGVGGFSQDMPRQIKRGGQRVPSKWRKSSVATRLRPAGRTSAVQNDDDACGENNRRHHHNSA